MDVPYLSLVIPAFNEERRILPTLQKITDYLVSQSYSWTVLVVDDGSSDRTAELVMGIAEEHARVGVLSVPHGGKGAAVRAGMLHVTGEYRFMCDSDLSMPIEQIERFLPPKLTEFDVAVGSREAPDANRYNESRFRHLQGRIFNRFAQVAAVPGINDTQCGFKCFRSDVVQSLFSTQRLLGWGFDVELLFLARRWGLRVVEVPIDWHHDADSRARRFRDGLGMGLDVLRVRANALLGKYRGLP